MAKHACEAIDLAVLQRSYEQAQRQVKGCKTHLLRAQDAYDKAKALLNASTEALEQGYRTVRAKE